MFLSEIDAALNIWGRTGKWLRSRRGPSTETISNRFLNLFESHGVHANQIPRFFGRGLTLKDVQSPENLTSALTEEVLRDACELFTINRNWLDGASEQIYEVHRCYRLPERFATLLDDLLKKSVNCSGYLLVGTEGKRPKYEEYDAVLIMQEEIGSIEGKSIYRFHLCDHWVFNYWKCRAHLAACVGYAWSRDVYVLGQYGDRAAITEIAEGRALIKSDEWGGGMGRYGPIWYPEDMTMNPEVYLQGLAERDRTVGERKGLELWLELECDGWMRNDHNFSCRKVFESALQSKRSMQVR